MKEKKVDPRNKLDVETLLRLGFTEHITNDGLKEKVYRLKVPYYHYQFQMKIGNYPASNPNCGVLCLYSPEQYVSAVPRHLVRKKHWSPKSKYRTLFVEHPKYKEIVNQK